MQGYAASVICAAWLVLHKKGETDIRRSAMRRQPAAAESLGRGVATSRQEALATTAGPISRPSAPAAGASTPISQLALAHRQETHREPAELRRLLAHGNCH
ncbi:hypothetical protein VFPFJ_00126 [Purpureocillium lilacinum]|uniref:Uncharacterized protein n=1 Tax=Purpureocillium lilacinum TaxID=33203 RepID=A0A179HX07_PURLI|nr:hypothetical protein VFPFJ_00126 [Purpureocillium lilacinum]OAQ94018.1 hypothetical protein VFPFJ_00126 [Purpureocillium lilacinum]